MSNDLLEVSGWAVEEYEEAVLAEEGALYGGGLSALEEMEAAEYAYEAAVSAESEVEEAVESLMLVL
jgi:hypothetical protein